MLRDSYAYDAEFDHLIDKLSLEMEPELQQIDSLLDDEPLYESVYQDMAQRHPGTLETGLPSTPVEVILRMLILKHLFGWTYRETEWHVRDSLILRRFCRIYFEDVPDFTVLNRWARQIRTESLESLNRRVTQLAEALRVTRGRKLRTDGTVVETNIAHPSDSKLLSDGVRVLGRALSRAKEWLVEHQEQVSQKSREMVGQALFRNRTRSAREQARRIADRARRQGQGSKEALEGAYQRLVVIAKSSVKQSQQVLEILRQEIGGVSQKVSQKVSQIQRVIESLETFLPRVQQVIQQTVSRVFEQKVVPAKQKLVSLFETHTDILCRGKAGKQTEFGRKVWLDEVDGGIVTQWRILEGNPPDEHQFQPAIDAHIDQFGKPPHQASGDRGVYSPENEEYAKEKGVANVVLPKPGHKDAKRREQESRVWFKKGRRYHAGVEGRISVLKRKHGLDRCLEHGEAGMERWVGLAVIAGNLAVMGRTLAEPAIQEEQEEVA